MVEGNTAFEPQRGGEVARARAPSGSERPARGAGKRRHPATRLAARPDWLSHRSIFAGVVRRAIRQFGRSPVLTTASLRFPSLQVFAQRLLQAILPRILHAGCWLPAVLISVTYHSGTLEPPAPRADTSHRQHRQWLRPVHRARSAEPMIRPHTAEPFAGKGSRIRPESTVSRGSIGINRQFPPISPAGETLFRLREREACGKNRPLGWTRAVASIFPGMLP